MKDPRENIPDDLPDEPSPAFEDEGMEIVETPVETEEEDGLQHVRINIRRALPDRRLDKYLSGRLGKSVSRTSLQRYIREGNVTVNGRIVKPSYVIRTDDDIDMLLPVVKPREIPPEPIPLDIVYEDDDFLAINKQANLIIHPARGNWTGTLVNGLAHYFRQNWRDIRELPTSGEAFRPGIVHRLDRDTTGILLVAKSELALWRLGRHFELRKIHKTYTAIVHGLLQLDEDVIDMPIGKHPKIREKYAVHRKTGEPYPATTKEAITGYRVLERLGPVGRSNAKFTLVELYPKTGRTHQLRVHMSALGHPIVGDRMYGGGPLYRSQLEGRADVAEGPLITRQALHAHTIEFHHPRTGERMKLEAPWPADFTETLSELRRRSGGGESR
ncbi:MAG TPA: RluA family pseudouridine synthase [Phycisphaerae bacterium]|nr:RluA family pseudouridine synthase [Phycisphaerae bacterium]